MKTRIQYKTAEEREEILIRYKDTAFVIEEEILFEGNFLSFENIKPIDIAIREISATKATKDDLLVVEEIALQTALNSEYLVAMKELGL